jgi:hypothetical protein
VYVSDEVGRRNNVMYVFPVDEIPYRVVDKESNGCNS